MKVKTNIKAGGRQLNHNETLVKAAAKSKTPAARPRGLQVRTGVRAGRGPVGGGAEGERAA